MEFIQAIRTGNPDAFFSKLSKLSQKQDDRFQEVLHDLEVRFQELEDFENLVESNELKKNVKEPKRKRAVGEKSKLLPNYSICTTDMKEPLGSSTPTETSTVPEERESCVKKLIVPLKMHAPVPVTPPNEFKCQIQTESVKKRIEEFEKRAAAVSTSASKIPVLTPVKKNFVIPMTNASLPKLMKPEIIIEKAKKTAAKTHIYVEKAKEVPIVKPRLTRNNSKILQEKTNVKTLKEKPTDPPLKKPFVKKVSADETKPVDLPVKKTFVKKVSADETKRKKEETTRKVTANKEALEKQEKQNRITASKVQQEKEKEAKIRAVHKQKEEKLMMLKKKHLETVKCVEKKPKKAEEVVNVIESYDIEDVVDGATTDEEDAPTKKIPSWATKENRKHQLCTQAWMNKKNTVHLWFYNRHLRYPKVDELFSVGVKTRPRTSSAVWNNSSICV